MLRVDRPAEALPGLVGRQSALGQDLQGHVPVEPRVVGAVDLTHAPRSQGPEDLVGAEAGARRQCHFWLLS